MIYIFNILNCLGFRIIFKIKVLLVFYVIIGKLSIFNLNKVFFNKFVNKLN